MYYRDRGVYFKVGGGDRTGAIPRKQAGLLSIEKVGRPWPRLSLFRGPCIFACSGENSQLGINCVCAQD